MPARMITVDAGSFLVVVSVAAVAALLAGMIQPYLAVPVVVIELILGIVVGPEVFDLAEPDEFISFFANLGLGMLFEAFAAVVIGGVSLRGGLGGLSGVFAGVLLLSTIDTAINVMGLDASYMQVIRGALMLLAVLLDSVKQSIERRYG